MMDKLHFHLLAREAISQLGCDNIVMDFGNVDEMWESIRLPEGYEKPPKEEFEAKLQELIDAQPLKELRQERNKRLTECDWVVIRATSTDTPVPEEWKTYMQALRDLPSTTEDPMNPVWPVPPE
jgi:hypothetical protein